jgi:hypothetical protein
METIFAIHGAWSSSVSFNYLQSKIKANWKFLSYDHSSETMEDIVTRANKEIPKNSIVIGHSLGGIISMLLHENEHSEKIITLASPLSGLELNMVQLYFTRSRLIKQITKESDSIRKMKATEYKKAVLHLVANRGFNPFIYEPNDGVLPQRIQTGWSAGKLVEVDANHYEILQSNETVENIKKFI